MPPGIGHGRDDFGADDRLAGRVDDHAVEFGRAAELQVGPGPVGRDLQQGTFAGPKPQVGLRYRVWLHLDFPRACLDRVMAVGVGLSLADRLDEVPVAEQGGAEADPGDPFAGLCVEDSPRDRHGPLDRHPDPGDGLRADLDLLGSLDFPSGNRGRRTGKTS